MPEPSFDGRRRYGVLAAGAVGGLTLLLAVVTPALAAGAGRRRARSPGPAPERPPAPRLSETLAAGRRPRRSVPRDPRGRVPLPGLLLHRVPGPHPLRRRRAPARAARAAAPEVRVAQHRSDRGRGEPRAPRGPPQPRGALLGRARRLPRRGPVQRRRPPARRRRHGHLAPAGLGRDAGARAPPPARYPHGRSWWRGRRPPISPGWQPHASSSRPAATRSRSATSPAARSSSHGAGRIAARRTRSSWSAPSCVTRPARTSTPVTRSRESPAPPACPSTCSRTTPWAPGASAATW